jgi:hypothetical protein
VRQAPTQRVRLYSSRHLSITDLPGGHHSETCRVRRPVRSGRIWTHIVVHEVHHTHGHLLPEGLILRAFAGAHDLSRCPVSGYLFRTCPKPIAMK